MLLTKEEIREVVGDILYDFSSLDLDNVTKAQLKKVVGLIEASILSKQVAIEVCQHVPEKVAVLEIEIKALQALLEEVKE